MHPGSHLPHYEELDDFLSGTMVTDVSNAISRMLKQIDAQNKNLQKQLTTATQRINSIFDTLKKHIDAQARVLTSRLSELIDAKISQNSRIRDELVTAELDFEHMFNRAAKIRSNSSAGAEALEEILHLYNNISSNYINNPNYLRALDARSLDDAVLFNNKAINFRLDNIMAATDTLFSEIDNHFAQVPALRYEEFSGTSVFKLRSVASFNTNHNAITLGAMAYVPPLDLLLTGGTEGSIKVWNLQDLKMLSQEAAHKSDVLRLQYILQKDMVVSASKDGEVKLWKIINQALNLVGNISYDNAAIFALHYLPVGNLLATGGEGNEIRLWEMVFAGAEPRSQLIKTESSRIDSLCRLDHASYLIAGTNSGTLLVYRYDATRHQLMYRLAGHKKDVFAMDCDQERSLLVSGSDDGTILVWILRERDGECLRRLKKEGTTIRSLVFLYEKEVVLTTHGDGFIRAWNTEKGVSCGSYLNDSNGGVVCRLAEQGNQIVSAFTDTVKIWSFY